MSTDGDNGVESEETVEDMYEQAEQDFRDAASGDANNEDEEE